MSFRFESGAPPEQGLRRIAREQIDRAIGEIDAKEGNPRATVHRVRKRCRMAAYWEAWRAPG